MVDRAGHRRGEREWLQRAWSSPEARLLVCGDGGLAIDVAGEGRTALARIRPPAGMTLDDVMFLGLDAGRPLFGVGLDAGASDDARAQSLGDPRQLALDEVPLTPSLQALARLEGDEAELAALLLSLANWSRGTRFCGRCGAPTAVAGAGHVRRCTRCGASHFPRTDAVVQVLVHDADRCLLGRSEHWPATFFSLVAGFVEPGETTLAAAHRELLEETSLRARELVAVGTQPWPMPHQLLFGFRGRCDVVGVASASDDLAEIRLLTRAELIQALADRRLMVPPRRSLAGSMIRTWLDERPSEQSAAP